jgi:hypothetical protein
MMPSRLSAGSVRNAASIAADAGRRAISTGGGYLIPCPCPGHGKGRGDLHPSLHIRDGEHRLLVRCFAGCAPADILRALGADRASSARAALAPEPSASSSSTASQSSDVARYLWKRTQPIARTHAAAYLAARGLAPPYPAAARFLPPSKRHPYPTLAAAMIDLRGRVVAIELTYLDPRKPCKADIEVQRRIVGPALGTSIHCAAAKGTLGLAEGFINALTCQRLFGVPTWASGSAERLAAVVLPPSVKRLIYFGDRDKAGVRALEKVRAAHPELEIIDRTSPDDRDWNELLQAGFVPGPELMIAAI